MTQQKAFLECPHDLDGYRYALAHKKVNVENLTSYFPLDSNFSHCGGGVRFNHRTLENEKLLNF